MGHGPFGIMFQLSSILSCLLLAGWVPSTIAETFECTGGYGNVSQCPSEKIVMDKIAQDALFPIEYTTQEICDCLRKDVFLGNLGTLSTFAFTDDQLDVMKEKLDETGYPDSVLCSLGGFSALMDLKDIKMWRFNSSKTLACLLAQQYLPEQAAAIIPQYTDSGGPMNAEALKAIRPKYIGLLDLKDLKSLSKNKVNMDIKTFMKLRKDAILKLRPSEVKGLMGKHLKDLKKEEKNPPVKDWIVKQLQSELNKLKIGLKGGRPEGYITIAPRPPVTSGGPRGLARHLFPSLLLTLLLTSFLS